MAQVIKEIQLEVSKPNFIQAIVAKQNDNKSRFLRVQLVDNGKKIEVPDTATVTINARRSDGGEDKFAGTVDDGQGTVLVPLTYWMLELEGRVISDVSVYSSDKILTTTNFTIEVERASCQDNDISPDDADIDVLTSLILDVQQVKTNYDVKHTYDPTSTNAISGKGVAKALENVVIDVDEFMSETSEMPVQNKIVKQYVDQSIADLVADGSISSDGRIQLKPNFANDVSECIDTSKLYVFPDGNIYAYMYSGAKPEIEIIEGGKGYWYWTDPGEKLHSTDGVYHKITNYIPVTEGDSFRYKGVAMADTDNTIRASWYDANKVWIDFVVVDGNPEVTITVPANAKYVRFQSLRYTSDVSNVVLEVEWIKCAASLIPQWAKTGMKFIPADYEEEIQDHEKRITDLENKNVDSILKGKKIVYDGDSICADWSSAGNGGAYPKIIADIVGGRFDNRAVGGGRLVTSNGATNKDGEAVTLSHSVVDNLVNLPTDGDLYCFEGGVNDHWNGVPLGDFDERDFESTLDTKTMCGALEYIFRYALTHFVGKPICFIITHKCRYQNEINGSSFADYREKMIGICEKYAVPYYDAWKDSGLGYWNTSQLDNYFVIHGDNETGDGCHPNEEGYKRYYVPQLISLFERIMPRV